MVRVLYEGPLSSETVIWPREKEALPGLKGLRVYGLRIRA